MAEKITDIKDKRSAFTLVELLLAMLVLAIVMGSVLSLGYAYIKHFEQANEITVAKDRATMVLTYLERRILHTGLGMHTVLVSGDDFRIRLRGFGIILFLMSLFLMSRGKDQFFCQINLKKGWKAKAQN